MRLLETEAAVLSVPTLFDEQTGRAALDRLDSRRGTVHDWSAVDALRTLRLAGVLEEWGGFIRVAEPLRDDLRARLAAEAPDIFREAAGHFAQHAANGLGEGYTAALGARPAAISAAVLRVMAALPEERAEPLDDLVGIVTAAAGGRRGDAAAAARQLEAIPERHWAVDRAIDFLRGINAWRNGDRATAAERFARVASGTLSDRPEAISRHLLGVVAASEGEFPKALDHLMASVALLRGQVDRHGLAQALTTLGRVLRAAAANADRDGVTAGERLVLAGTALDEAVRIGSDLGDRELEGRALSELARVEHDYGSLESAIYLAETALDLLRRPEDLMQVRIVLGSLYRDAGMDAAASEALGVAAALAAESGQADRTLGRILNVQASADRRANRTEDAIARARESLSVGELIGDRRHSAHAMHTLAAALLDRGTFQDRVDAERYLSASTKTLRSLGDLRGVEMVERTWARLHKGPQTLGNA
jgi:tetratricopeptide (TPR) repeat protein